MRKANDLRRSAVAQDSERSLTRRRASAPAPGDGPRGDLSVGAFTVDGPWDVDPASMGWRRGLDRLRTAIRAEVPRLTRKRRLPPGPRVVRVVRVLGTAVAGWYLVERHRHRGTPASKAGLSRRLRKAFEKLGPTYIKLGQILSSGEGIFPEELVGEFRLLRDRVPAEPFDVVRQIVESDLGRPLDDVFSSFDQAPLAAASIAQVHSAVLRATGETVVVKVQRPSVSDLVRCDLAVMSWLAPALVGRIPISALANPPALVELFAETIVEELDFRLEAENMLDIARLLAADGHQSVVVPRPHPTLVTRRVLVMERLDGFGFDDVAGMKAAGVDTPAVIHALTIMLLEGVMLHGVFHGDLHGGNLFVRPDNTVALLDYGITGRLTPDRRVAFLRLLIGGTTNDVRMQMHALVGLGMFAPGTDIDVVIADLGLAGPVLDPTKMSAAELIEVIRDLTKKLLGYGARMPKELMLFVKNMLFLDNAVAVLAPELDIFGQITRVATHFALHHGTRIMTDIGIDVSKTTVDLGAFRAALGVSEPVNSLTYRELQERRDLVRERLEDHLRKP